MLNWDLDPEASGWVDDSVAVEAVAEAQPMAFCDTPANTLEEGELPRDCMGTEVQRKLLGRAMPSWIQGSAGFCCGAGAKHTYDAGLIWEIVAGVKQEYRPVSAPFLYSVSRSSIGKPGWGWKDGSTGAWVAQAAKDYGGLPEGKYGNIDLEVYDIPRTREWARNGTPQPLLDAAKPFKCESILRVSTLLEAKKAIAQGYYILVASGIGFSGKRNAQGVMDPWGRWAHCMALMGYYNEGGEDLWHIKNSWDERVFSGPTGRYDIPKTDFMATSKSVQMILNAKDSWAICNVAGAPLRKDLLNWSL